MVYLHWPYFQVPSRNLGGFCVSVVASSCYSFLCFYCSRPCLLNGLGRFDREIVWENFKSIFAKIKQYDEFDVPVSHLLSTQAMLLTYNPALIPSDTLLESQTLASGTKFRKLPKSFAIETITF